MLWELGSHPVQKLWLLKPLPSHFHHQRVSLWNDRMESLYLCVWKRELQWLTFLQAGWPQISKRGLLMREWVFRETFYSSAPCSRYGWSCQASHSSRNVCAASFLLLIKPRTQARKWSPLLWGWVFPPQLALPVTHVPGLLFPSWLQALSTWQH